MTATVQRISALGACLLAGITLVCWRAETSSAGPSDPMSIATHTGQPETRTAALWDHKAAAAYLDQRAGWWMEWPKAVRDHETFCVSCHTAVPYALSRPALRGDLGESGASPNERALVENVTKRVRLWKEVETFYKDTAYGANMGSESRVT